MLRSLLFNTALSLLYSRTLALEWLGPRATRTPSLPDGTGFTPKPTKGPQYNVVANANHDLKLFRRQRQSKYPNTCGYIDGNGAYSFTCSGAHACAYNVVDSAFGCCSGTTVSADGSTYFTNCHVETSTTSCYASTEADLCTGICTISAAICTYATAPICRTVLQLGTGALDPVTYTLYDCIPLGGRTRLTLADTSSYFDFSVTPNPLVDPSYTFDGTTFVPLDEYTRSTTTTTTTTSSSRRPGPTPIDEETPAPMEEEEKQEEGGGSSGSGRKKNGSSTGAIAGGVVGGLAAVGVLVGAVIWSLMRRKQKARQQAAAVQEVSHVTYVHDGK